MSIETAAHSATPDYFDLGYYARVHALARSWRELEQIPEERLPSDADRAACERLLFTEARLIDSGRLEAWLELYTEDCGYWVPTDVDGAHPARMVTWEFNDRRRLEERVERLATGRAFSQIPVTRTTHLYTNIEMLTSGPDEMEVICNFLIQTNLNGRPSPRAGWNGFLLRRTQAGWRIVLKRIALFDADLPQINNSFTL
jgi:3-phenylpropionate/cinnamic acid dioxygenase small subunit